MSKKILYIFVEGPNDEKFIEAFIQGKKCLSEKYKKITCWLYSKKNSRKINNFIDSLIKTKQDYIFLADADFKNDPSCFPSIKKELAKKYTSLDEDKIWIVIEEIESWFLAGFDQAFCIDKKLAFYKNTEKVTKEIFDKIAKKKGNKKTHNQLIDFLIRKKADFSFTEVKNRNESLTRFHNHFELSC
jgi:hypothetical protein